jgi:hypothetical protein
MTEKRWLYFALGVTTVISIGAVTNQIAPMASGSGVAVDDTGIIFPDGSVQMTAAPRDPRRAFYLTISTYNGDQVDGTDGNGGGVCAPGFHFASLYEILDVSTLRYATDTEGGGDVYRTGDSGQGPPSLLPGWIRTGHSPTTAQLVEGQTNCLAWTDSDFDTYGSKAYLNNNWAAATGSGNPSGIIMPWDSQTQSCLLPSEVWCVENYPGSAGS